MDALGGELIVSNALKEVTAEAAAEVPEEELLTPSLIIGPTKTYARRRVSLPRFLRDELAAHMAGLPGGRDAFLFTTATGEPVRHNNFYKRFYAPAVAASLPDRDGVRFHDLRHTCAAWLIDAGAHPLQIKLRLGHEDIKTTMNSYGHLFPSTEPELADLLDAGYNAQRSRPRSTPVPLRTHVRISSDPRRNLRALL